MNRKQLIVMWVAAILIAAMVLYPPKYHYTPAYTEPGYRSAEFPEYNRRSVHHAARTDRFYGLVCDRGRIDVARLLLPIAGVVLIGAAAFVTAGRRA